MTKTAAFSKTDGLSVLNDNFRSTFVGGRIVMTLGVSELPIDIKARIILAVQSFDNFSEAIDPYGDRDFGDFQIEGETYLWKIDYAPEMDCGSNGVADPEASRVLTIMRADEY